MAQVLRPIETLFEETKYPDLIVGLGKTDDAAVWRLDDDRSLVVSTDFFTPIVDDPFQYGAIAATNSLSDIYAMGGTPFMALNIAAFPPDLPSTITGQILLGGAQKAQEAGVVIAGGHTIQDKEPKYGMVVLGFVNPNRMMTKSGAKPGDILVISKPLGFGTTSTAIKEGKATRSDIEEVVDWMSKLNRDTAILCTDFGVKGATDVTGFSLLGHAWEMASSSGVGIVFDWEKIPFTSGAKNYASEFIFPGGASDNMMFFKCHVEFKRNLKEEHKLLLFDPQTSGGLLAAVPPDKITNLLLEAEKNKLPIWTIGKVIEGEKIEVV